MRENLVFLTKNIKILVDFCRNLLEFEGKYLSDVPIGAAGAKDWEF